MKLAFCLYKYFPYGGLERDFLRVAHTCQQRGYSIHVFTMNWQGDVPTQFDVTVLAVDSWSNHGRNRIFTQKLRVELAKDDYDAVIGFNKMPNLDLYYAADPCYVARIAETKSWLFPLTPRYRHFADYERAVFGVGSRAELMMISKIEQEKFIACYGTPRERFHLMSPGINPDRKAPANAQAIRAQWRKEFEIHADQKVILMVGSAFRRKGLDRSLIALAQLPSTVLDKCRLMVIGHDNPVPFEKQAKKLGVEDKLQFLQGRDDVPNFLLGADLFVHPAYSENTGTVILEAMVAGLPVLITENCGYSFHVKDSGAGLVVDQPFHQRELNQKMEVMLTDDPSQWSQNGIRYGQSEDLYSLPQVASDLIERVAQRRSKAVPN